MEGHARCQWILTRPQAKLPVLGKLEGGRRRSECGPEEMRLPWARAGSDSGIGRQGGSEGGGGCLVWLRWSLENGVAGVTWRSRDQRHKMQVSVNDFN